VNRVQREKRPPKIRIYCLDILDRRRQEMSWQLQEAKQRFSELVRRALEEGPQTVTRHGEEVVVVVPAEEFRRLTGDKPDFKEFLMSAPEGLELIVPTRPANDLPREIDLTDES
jgi:prevent-host-death family protein